MSASTAPPVITIEDVQIRASLDDAWRQQLLADPEHTLNAIGVKFRDGVSVRVIEQADGEFVLPIPPKAKDAEQLDEDALDGVSGGTILGVAATLIPEAAPVIGYGAAAAWTFGGVVVGGVAGWAGSHF